MWLVILSFEPEVLIKETTLMANKITNVSVNTFQHTVIIKEDLIFFWIFFIAAWKRFCLVKPQTQRSFQLHGKGWRWGLF